MNREDAIKHHPLIEALSPWMGTDSEEYFVDFLGIRTKKEFLKGLLRLPQIQQRMGYVGQGGENQERPLPAFDEEYFEWVDLVETVQTARDHFTMLELGAGYGRWCVRAAELLRRINPLPLTLVAVEAEPTHFEWLSGHFVDNGIDPRQHRLLQAVVGAQKRRVSFWIGDPSGWYGQAVVAQSPRRPTPRAAVKKLLRFALRPVVVGREARGVPSEAESVKLPSVRLRDLLADLGKVDLLDMDVQGAELDALRPDAETVDRQVARVHIGTHGPDIEAGLRSLFGDLGWLCVRDFGCGQTVETPYGVIAFEDGVQTWVNPRLQHR